MFFAIGESFAKKEKYSKFKKSSDVERFQSPEVRGKN
jgi:hypothetical protein